MYANGGSSKNNWDTCPLVGFDTETTGTDPRQDRIVSASFVYTDWHEAHSVLISPQIDVPARAKAVHGLSTEHLRANGVQPSVGLEWIKTSFEWYWERGIPIVGHNVSYDLSIVDAELARCGLGWLSIDGPVIDTLVLDRQHDPYRPGRRTLATLAEHYGVSLENAHSADSDARAAVEIARVLLTQVFHSYSPAQLFESQIVWARQQSILMRKHLSTKSGLEGIAGLEHHGWPLLRK